MEYDTIPGVEKQVSRLVMGAADLGNFDETAGLFDAVLSLGGNAFDTAFIYGSSEDTLGKWIESRGVREDVVILDKGAHTPKCNPADFLKQFEKSLQNLRTDYVDIYMLHRDNPEIPVGEFMDALNEQVSAGRIRALGASNWTTGRIDEANAYASANGLRPFVAISNQLSLARMIEPPWAGCLSATDPAVRQWHERTGTALMPWSSQARGFFTGIADPNDRSNEELVRCWYADDNFERLARTQKLAKERGVPPIVIALAWVLHQPFPTFPLVGPKNNEEAHSSFGALDVRLSPEETAWLDLAEK